MSSYHSIEAFARLGAYKRPNARKPPAHSMTNEYIQYIYQSIRIYDANQLVHISSCLIQRLAKTSRVCKGYSKGSRVGIARPGPLPVRTRTRNPRGSAVPLLCPTEEKFRGWHRMQCSSQRLQWSSIAHPGLIPHVQSRFKTYFPLP